MTYVARLNPESATHCTGTCLGLWRVNHLLLGQWSPLEMSSTANCPVRMYGISTDVRYFIFVCKPCPLPPDTSYGVTDVRYFILVCKPCVSKVFGFALPLRVNRVSFLALLSLLAAHTRPQTSGCRSPGPRRSRGTPPCPRTSPSAPCPFMTSSRLAPASGCIPRRRHGRCRPAGNSQQPPSPSMSTHCWRGPGTWGACLKR